MDASEVRNNFRVTLNQVEQDGEHVPISRWGTPIAVIVPSDWYDRARRALGEDSEEATE